jgi:hypothetical protein
MGLAKSKHSSLFWRDIDDKQKKFNNIWQQTDKIEEYDLHLPKRELESFDVLYFDEE